MKRFPRTSPMHRAGTDAAEIIQGRILKVNLVNWTVDVMGAYDQKFWLDVQVSSTYMHYNNGEGSYTMPEVGATCYLCLPSDSSPPFVLCFVMPPTVVDDTGTADAPEGTTSHGQTQQYATDATFSGGRPRAQSGDIIMRTRDDNFVILHRGGVLQLGATPICQRMYIPLNNLISDFSGNYEHHNTAGAISWGIQQGPATSHYPAQFQQTFRVFADDKFADIRLTEGKVYNPMTEPDGDLGDQDAISEFSLGTDPDSPIIYELVVAPKGFDADSGNPASTDIHNQTVLRLFFDRAGGTFLRAEGNVFVGCHKKLRIKVDDDFILDAKANMTVTVEKDMVLNGKGSITLTGGVVRMGAGQAPVARIGDIVTVILPFTPMAAAPVPLPLSGTITSGNSQVLA